MGQIAKLIEVIKQLSCFDAEYTIYAEQPWTENSRAMVAFEPEGGTIPSDALVANMAYLIEVNIASEFLEDWEASLKDSPSLPEKTQRLIQYARDDA